ncbi:MAG: tetratricopeptide repeat protein [Myxococcota bacterium]
MAWRWKRSANVQGDIDVAWRKSLRAAIAGDWRRAEKWLEELVSSDTENLEAYFALASLYREHDAIGRALRMHQNLLLRSDLTRAQRREALLELARDFDAGGFRERATASYEEILIAEPRNLYVLERLISILIERDEFPRALSLIRRLRRLNRETADRLEIQARLTVARRQLESEDYAGARKNLKRCLRRDESCALAWMILGDLEAACDKPKKAVAAWKEAAHSDQGFAPELYRKLAEAWTALGKPIEFERFLSDRLTTRPTDQTARIALARWRFQRGEGKQSIEELARAIEKAPQDIGLRAEYGRQLIASGQDTEALKAFSEFLDLIERADWSTGLNALESRD